MSIMWVAVLLGVSCGGLGFRIVNLRSSGGLCWLRGPVVGLGGPLPLPLLLLGLM